MILERRQHSPERAKKFRQAAIAYLHYAALYWYGSLALYRADLFPDARGPVAAWFAFGIAIPAIVVWGLWWWQDRWFARVVWAVISYRLPFLMDGAFLGGAERVAPGFYLAAGLVVIAVMWMLARAAWDV